MNEIATMERRQPEPNAQQSDGKHAAWVAGRVQVLLSHYFQPDNPAEVTEAALDDWVAALVHFPKQAIEHACQTYLRDQPRRRPTPGDILARASSFKTSRTPRKSEGDRSKLSHDELQILEEKILPTARRWVEEIPELAEFGRQTLAYWGEAIPGRGAA